jgi:hypothetical protein
MSGIQTASTGCVTTEFGINRKAMMAMKDHAKNVCTIHRWRVAWRTVAEIHHPRMRAARAKSLKWRMRLWFLENHEVSISFKLMMGTLFEMASASPLRRGMPRSSLERESVEDFFSAIFSCTGLPTETILNLNLRSRWRKTATRMAPRRGKERGESLPTRKGATVAERIASYIEDLGPALPLLLPSEKVNHVLVDLHGFSCTYTVPFLRSRKTAGKWQQSLSYSVEASFSYVKRPQGSVSFYFLPFIGGRRGISTKYVSAGPSVIGLLLR